MKNRFLRWHPSWISAQKDFRYFSSTCYPDAPYQVLSQLAFSSGEGAKNRFSRRPPWHGGHLRFPIRTILANIDLQVTPILPTKFRVNWPFCSGEEAKIGFQDGHHLGFPIGTILAIFDLQVSPMFPTKFKVNKPFRSGEEAKNRFSRWPSWRPSWISDRNDFSYF